MTLEASAFVLTWIAIALLTLAVAGLIRQLRLFSVQTRYSSGQGMVEIGSRVLDLPDDVSSRLRVLFFSDPACNVCRERLREFVAEVSGVIAVADELLVVVRDRATGAEGRDEEWQPKTLEHRQDLFLQLRVTATPAVAVVSTDGTLLAQSPLGSSAAVRQMALLLRSLAPEEARGDTFTG